MNQREIKKAIIPAAGLGTRFLPATKAQPKEMLPIVDKPAIQFIVEEAISCGITDILIITNSNKRSIEDHFDHSFELEKVLEEKKKYDLLKLVKSIGTMVNLHFIRQKEAKGLGHAVLCARTFINQEPFAVLLGDDIVFNEKNKKSALQQLIEIYKKFNKSIIGVQSVDKKDVNKYGIITPKNQEDNIYELADIIEKPKIEEAPSNLAVMGRYILTPNIFDVLEKQEKGANDEIQLTDALKKMLFYEQIYAKEFEGRRYDIGDKLGFLKATIDYALKEVTLKEDFLNYIKSIVKEY